MRFSSVAACRATKRGVWAFCCTFAFHPSWRQSLMQPSRYHPPAIPLHCAATAHYPPAALLTPLQPAHALCLHFYLSLKSESLLHIIDSEKSAVNIVLHCPPTCSPPLSPVCTFAPQCQSDTSHSFLKVFEWLHEDPFLVLQSCKNKIPQTPVSPRATGSAQNRLESAL